ncbi:hypothetical protein [Membranihabitans marinus]|uniref:hypothetical protein n=1 Tax=Membranihabitans marinus TaxID=1227546 RepID=UPI001F350E83|nr:hypothetical protein [Membranihabitans marinus]
MKKWILRLSIVLLIAVIALLFWAKHNMRDRHPGYEVNITLKQDVKEVDLQIGFGKTKITPTIIDTWEDANGNARFDEGEVYNDVNNNGEFDAVWIAGFSNNKPANGVHDDVWARTMLVDDGESRVAMVSLDAVGYMYADVVDIRQSIPSEWDIDYVLIASTHTHESNDLIGMWGPDIFHSGVDPDHMAYVKAQVKESIAMAIKAIRPAKIILGQDLTGRDSILIKDTRKPIVKATGVHVMQVLDAVTDTTLGSIINWANHPETLWSKNLLISSDFPHYIRESLENGIYDNGQLIQAGIGGTAIFFNGAVGGLMAPHPSLPFNDPIRDTVLSEPSFEKTRTLGEQIAMLGMAALSTEDTLSRVSPIHLEARSLYLPIANRNFRIASAIGLLERGTSKWFQTRSEVAAFSIGPAAFISIPGELYPEILYGGIESPPGQDFDISPVEVPALKTKIKQTYTFYLGLSNDEIGYIIPKSEWDEVEPWLYLDDSDSYGEENSLGPETAPILYDALSELIEKL